MTASFASGKGTSMIVVKGGSKGVINTTSRGTVSGKVGVGSIVGATTNMLNNNNKNHLALTRNTNGGASGVSRTVRATISLVGKWFCPFFFCLFF